MSPEESEMKVCPYCGKKTSVHANFCYYCARELVARPERPMEEPKPSRVNWVAVGVVVLFIVGIALFILAR